MFHQDEFCNELGFTSVLRWPSDFQASFATDLDCRGELHEGISLSQDL